MGRRAAAWVLQITERLFNTQNILVHRFAAQKTKVSAFPTELTTSFRKCLNVNGPSCDAPVEIMRDLQILSIGWPMRASVQAALSPRQDRFFRHEAWINQRRTPLKPFAISNFALSSCTKIQGARCIHQPLLQFISRHKRPISAHEFISFTSITIS
jgi:hypothetical protein